MDTAELLMINYLDEAVNVLSRESSCYKCSWQSEGWLANLDNRTLRVNTSWSTELLISRGQHEMYCHEKFHFQEYGRYKLEVLKNGTKNIARLCNIVRDNDSWDFCIPIYIAVGLLVFFTLIWILVGFLMKRNLLQKVFRCLPRNEYSLDCSLQEDLGIAASGTYVRSTNVDSESSSNTTLSSTKSPSSSSAPRRRLRSLDSFRGFCLVVMIFVNSGGGGYTFFEHVAWNGLYVADLVFPWFIFIMGTAMGLSLRGLVRREGKSKAALQISRRSLILCLLGLMLNSANGGWLEDLRLPGVLQRFGFCFFVVGMTEVLSCCQTLPKSGTFRDQQTLLTHWVLQVTLLTAHLCLTFLLPLPDGCPTGYIGPGGRHMDGLYWNCTGGAASYIDRLILGPRHLYQNAVAGRVYGKGGIHDPEGLLGCLTSCVLCFNGFIAGRILSVFSEPSARLSRFLVWGLLTGSIGILLCKGSQEEGWIPLNKNLWSVSFILCMAGAAYILFAIAYLVIDVFNVWSGAPFFYPGMNSIIVYVGAQVLYHYLPFNFKVQNTHAQNLAIDFLPPTLWTVVAYLLYRRKIFISI